jgi:hypothetical protein
LKAELERDNINDPEDVLQEGGEVELADFDPARADSFEGGMLEKLKPPITKEGNGAATYDADVEALRRELWEQEHITMKVHDGAGFLCCKGLCKGGRGESYYQSTAIEDKGF